MKFVLFSQPHQRANTVENKTNHHSVFYYKQKVKLLRFLELEIVKWIKNQFKNILIES
jgi:hypothetical protein